MQRLTKSSFENIIIWEIFLSSFIQIFLSSGFRSLQTQLIFCINYAVLKIVLHAKLIVSRASLKSCIRSRKVFVTK